MTATSPSPERPPALVLLGRRHPRRSRDYSHFHNCFETCSGSKSVASHPFKKDGVCNTLRLLRSARPTTDVGGPGFQKVLPHTIKPALSPNRTEWRSFPFLSFKLSVTSAEKATRREYEPRHRDLATIICGVLLPAAVEALKLRKLAPGRSRR